MSIDAENYMSGDSSGLAALTPPVSKKVMVYRLAAGTARTVTWPSGYNFVNISAVFDYWVNTQAAAAVPTGDVLTGAAPVLNMGQRRRGPSDESFSIISASAQDISIEFWK